MLRKRACHILALCVCVCVLCCTVARLQACAGAVLSEADLVRSELVAAQEVAQVSLAQLEGEAAAHEREIAATVASMQQLTATRQTATRQHAECEEQLQRLQEQVRDMEADVDRRKATLRQGQPAWNTQQQEVRTCEWGNAVLLAGNLPSHRDRHTPHVVFCAVICGGGCFTNVITSWLSESLASNNFKRK